MTQIIAALTQDYILVATDRRLTVAAGPDRGKTVDDDACKLVNLCNMSAITYTGLASLDGVPTHKWIALRLSEENCRTGGSAARRLAEAAVSPFRSVGLVVQQTFLISGWALQSDGKLLPTFRWVTNMTDANGQCKEQPGSDFQVSTLGMTEDVDIQLAVIGHPLIGEAREKRIYRSLRRLVKHKIGPKQAMEHLIDEIVFTSQNSTTVGCRVLCCCIPRAAAEVTISTGAMTIINDEPTLKSASFYYFNPASSKILQYGPTFVCGAAWLTDVVAEALEN
jgi:hypothetical protein